MTKIILTVKYRDDTERVFECSDVPAVGPNWLTIYSYDDPVARTMIPSEAIAQIDWTFK